MSEWFEDESFWKVMFPFLFPPERIDGAGEEVDLISALAKFGEGDVLDLCCGPGRHSVALDIERRFELAFELIHHEISYIWMV